MEFKIIKQEKNPFLEREEITLEIKNEITPTADEVKSAIGKDPALTVIKKINTNFGKQTSFAKAVVYNNLKAKNKIETIPKKVRKKIKAEKKAQAEAEKKAKAEAETKPEEPKEKPKPEEKQNE